MKNNYTWQEIAKELVPTINTSDQKDLSSLFIHARNKGVGRIISFQKTEYSKEHIRVLKKLIDWWQFLNISSSPEWRTKEFSRKIQLILIDACLKNRPLNLFAIFCPSYKKETGQLGYNAQIGNNTRESIKKLMYFINQSSRLGMPIQCSVFFSDMLIENFDKIKNTNYRVDLEKNYQSFKSEILKDSNSKISVNKLSSIKKVVELVGACGVTEGEIKLSGGDLSNIVERNKVFYGTELGWSDKMTLNRSRILALSYDVLGRIFKEMYPDGIMFWVESAYERGVMYNASLNKNFIPIIYPRKT